MRTIVKYTGDLQEHKMYQFRSDGNKVKITRIFQEPKNKVWTCELKYADSQTKQDSTLQMPCYDFEQMIKRGYIYLLK